jgi:HEAT repeat protein
LRLLGDIGHAQRFKAAKGEPSTKPSITLAIPAIQAILQRTNHSGQVWAAQAACYIGSEAAATIPNLIKLAENEQDSGAIQGLGMMGPLASNAVPVLIKIATDPTSNKRRLALQSIGRIGEPARSAAPMLSAWLKDSDEELRITALRALANIGHTPDEAVLMLTTIQHGTNDWAGTLATLALWNRDHQNADHHKRLTAALQGKHSGWLLFDLSILGSNAAPFVPAITKLLDDPDPNKRQRAKIVLRTIELRVP